MKKKGVITVFLVMILSVLSVFVIGISEVVRRYAARCEGGYATDVAVRSCFAEYNRRLYERYHILLIDSSYKNPESGPDRVKEHFKMYLEGNLSQNEIRSVEISDHHRAGDNGNKYLYEQAVLYARKNYGKDERINADGDDAYFISYLMHVLGRCGDPSEGGVRMGEIEYLLYGSALDEENIELAGKDYEDFGEVTYEEYLCSCLEREDTDILSRRFADIVTENMRENDSPGFDLENCYYGITFEADLKGFDSDEYSITRSYAYEYEDP